MIWTHPITHTINFQTKKETPMKNVLKLSLEEVEWTITIAC
jgi:hypothetical protein